MAHEEYLRRNLLVAKAEGAKAAVSVALKRLEMQTRPPRWLVKSLNATLVRLDPLPHDLAMWRDMALDAPEFARQGKETRGSNESHSGGNPGENSACSPADDRGIPTARSSEGGNVGKNSPDVSIQSCEPVDSNSVSVGAEPVSAPVVTWRCTICNNVNPDDATHCRQCEYSRMVMREGHFVPRDGRL